MNIATVSRFTGFLLLALGFGVQAATFEVNSAGDEPDANPGNGSCATAGGQCTLRAAIQEANANPGSAPHRIRFADSVSAITLTSGLPQINVPLEINGSRADASNPRVDINGNGLQATGFQFTDSASQSFNPSPPVDAPRAGLFNLVVRNFSGNGVSLDGRGFTVQNCYIGTLPDGQSASPNQDHGIAISSPLPGTPLPDLPDLGGVDLGDIDAVLAFLISTLAAVNAPTTIDGNLISGNGLDGVNISGQYTAMVFVRGNRIGVNADGDQNIPNASRLAGHGVQLRSAAFANFIGPFNLISGNNRPNSSANGVFVNTGGVRFPNFVAGNIIGPGGGIDPFSFDPTNPDVSDLLDFGNLENGIQVDASRTSSAPANPTPYSVVIGPANLISFNGSATPTIDNMNADPNAGIFITGNSADAYVLGNVIGGLRFEVAGNPQLLGGNKGDGIQITTANHQIGGTSLAERNTISGNGRNGVTLRGSSTRNVWVQGNLIGRDVLNLLDLGQGGDGIRIDMAQMLTIGGSEAGAGNTIAASARNGIKITDSSAWSNLISRNSLFGNASGGSGIGIDLDRTVNAPDATSVPPVPGNISNRGQTAPVICSGAMGQPAACMGAGPPSFDAGSNQVSLSAVLEGQPNTDYVIESFLVDAPGNLGNGEGRLFMGSQTVSSDGAGIALVSVSSNAPVGGGSSSSVTLTATNVSPTTLPDGSTGPANNTSEFSSAAQLQTLGSLAFNPANLGFGTVNVGASVDLVTTLAHDGGEAVTGITLAVSGAGFSLQSSTCGAEPFQLGPGESCELGLRFAPVGAGAAAGSLLASASVGNGASLGLSGTGQVSGSLAFADPGLDLGGVVIGSGMTATTTLSNPGGAPVIDILVSVTGTGFSRQGGSCDAAAFTLAPAASCTVTVRFEPTLPGSANGQLSAAGSDANASIGLTGIGLAPAALALDQASYDFGSVSLGDSSDRTATLSNPGDVDATDVQVSPSGAGFSRVGGSCGMAAFTLAAGQSCTLELRFEPAAPGPASGSVAASADGGLTANATLGGIGVPAAALLFAPPTLAFGDVPVGSSATLSSTLSNSGGSEIAGIELAVSGAGYSREGGDCPSVAFALAPAASCTVGVRFEPGAGGSASGSLSAVAADASASAVLSGNGLGLAQIAWNQADYAFGDVVVGAFAEQTATLGNSGGQPASNVQVDVTGAGFSRVGGTCSATAFSLAAGESCTVTVRLTPAAPGGASGSLGASADGGLAASAGLSGNALAAGALAFDPVTLAFGGLPLGTSAMLSTTLSNGGGTPVADIVLALAGAGFTRDGGSCPDVAFSLVGGASCTVVVRFEPGAAGAASGTLTATATDALATAALSGSGLGPAQLAWSPSSLDFGDVTVGAFAELSATLSNVGGQAADGVQLAVTGTGFSRVGGSCGMAVFSLAGGDSCTVVLRFGPAAAGAASGELGAIADGGLSAMAALVGTGLEPGALAFDPAVLAFGDVELGSSASLTSTLANSGGSSISGISLSVTGSGFSRAGGSCDLAAFTLAAGASCTVIVEFAPGALGAVNGVLSASSGVEGASAALGGNGTPVPVGSVGFTPPTGLDFGGVAVGGTSSQSLTLTNTGSAALAGLVVSVEGPFTLVGNTCPASLAPAASCSVSIQFQPAAAGAASGLLRVVADGGVNVTAPLIGTGLAGQPVAPVMVPTLDRYGLLALLFAFAMVGAWSLRRQG